MACRSLILAAVALLLVPVASAQSLDLHARGMDAQGTRVDGSPVVVFASNGNGTQILLSADQVHVEEHVEVRDPPASLVDPGQITGEEPETRHREADHEDVRWTGGLTRSNAYILVTATPEGSRLELSAQALQVSLSPDGQDGPRVTPEVGDTTPYHPSVTGLTLVRSAESRLEVQGDFEVRYWSGRLGGPTADGPFAYEAGTSEQSREPVPMNPAVRWTQDVFVTLHVRNGTLSVATPTPADLHVHLDGPTLLTGARATLQGVTGDGAAGAGTVVLEDFSLLADAAGDGLRVWSPPPQAEPASVGDLPGPPDSLPLALLAVAAVAALALFLRSRRPVSVKMLLDDMDQRAYRRVVRHADAVMRRTGSEAVAVMKTVALLALGRARRALRFLEDLPSDLRPAEGMDPFLRAHALNELGQEDEARRFLREALGQNPGLVVELSQLPRLRALLPDDAPSEVYA